MLGFTLHNALCLFLVGLFLWLLLFFLFPQCITHTCFSTQFGNHCSGHPLPALLLTLGARHSHCLDSKPEPPILLGTKTFLGRAPVSLSPQPQCPLCPGQPMARIPADRSGVEPGAASRPSQVTDLWGQVGARGGSHSFSLQPSRKCSSVVKSPDCWSP